MQLIKLTMQLNLPILSQLNYFFIRNGWVCGVSDLIMSKVSFLYKETFYDCTPFVINEFYGVFKSLLIHGEFSYFSLYKTKQVVYFLL